MFFSYNNGITATASHIEKEYNTKTEKGGMIITSITNFQIVNGGQTTMVIVDESRKGTPVHQVRVPIRIVEIKSEHAADPSVWRAYRTVTHQSLSPD